MDEILRTAVVLAALGYFWWSQIRRTRRRQPLQLVAPDLDGDAQVALHLARHVAAQRGRRLGAVDLLYALVQDDTVATAIREAGGDPAAIERRVDDALDEDDPVDGEIVLYNARGSCASLWSSLTARAPVAAALTRAGGVEAVDVMFFLAHGKKEPPLALPFAGKIDVVFMNDDFTPMDLVVEVLRDIFGLEERSAIATMLRVHKEGRGVVGALSVDDAARKIAEARERARLRGYPLWIQANPA